MFGISTTERGVGGSGPPKGDELPLDLQYDKAIDWLVGQRKVPRDWRFKSAATWLLSKVEAALRAEKKKLKSSATAAADGELFCESSVARMINGTPCATPCLLPCRDAIRRAYT